MERVRIMHDHILQADHVEDCPACTSRDEDHLTRQYAILQNHAMNRGW